MEAPHPGFGEVFEGECNGPVFGSCGKHHRRFFSGEKAPDTSYIRVRCGACDKVAVLQKKQT